MDADQIVRDFCAAWSRSDLESILSFFTEDAVYHNIPMEACEGRENIRNLIGGMFSTIASIDFDIRILIYYGRCRRKWSQIITDTIRHCC